MKVKTRIKMVDKQTWFFLIKSINHKQNGQMLIVDINR
jgi:hypothetical protein